MKTQKQRKDSSDTTEFSNPFEELISRPVGSGAKEYKNKIKKSVYNVKTEWLIEYPDNLQDFLMEKYYNKRYEEQALYLLNTKAKEVCSFCGDPDCPYF